MSLYIGEIFSSIQGEGPLVGCRQIFLRFAGCNLNCAYCDTNNDPYPLYCRWEKTPGAGDFNFLPNPLDVYQVAPVVKELNPSLHHCIALTGGEPLLYSEILCDLIPLLPPARHGIYLETNGSLPEKLNQIIGFVDFIAMDIKLPSISCSRPLWLEHEEFLAIASKKQLFVKIVVGDNTSVSELNRAIKLVKEAGDFPLIIQPVTFKDGSLGISSKHLLTIQDIALRQLSDVRVIPQTHKFLRML